MASPLNGLTEGTPLSPRKSERAGQRRQGRTGLPAVTVRGQAYCSKILISSLLTKSKKTWLTVKVVLIRFAQ